jgi:vacuolar-type H+-ATPase subunit E/Vma4
MLERRVPKKHLAPVSNTHHPKNMATSTLELEALSARRKNIESNIKNVMDLLREMPRHPDARKWRRRVEDLDALLDELDEEEDDAY